MQCALILQTGGPQTYQRLPGADATDAQKAAIKRGLDRLKQMG